MTVPYKVVSLDELDLDPKANTFFDTETCGFYGRVRLAQFYQKGQEYVQMVEWPSNLMLIQKLEQLSCVVMHNSHYDLTTLQERSQTKWIPKTDFEDTFLLARIAIPHLDKYDLESLLEYVIGNDPYAEQGLDKKKLQKSKWNSSILTKSQLLYAATDVYYMPQLFDTVALSLSDESYQLDKRTVINCLDFQWNGLPTDHDIIDFMFTENEKEMNRVNLPINVNSYKQVREFLDVMKTDDLSLAHMEARGNTDAANVRKVRKLSKQNSFLKKFDTDDGRIYGKFKPSARSGRMTSNDQNLQQLPRDLKRVFQAPEGRILIYADYSQLELRTIAAITACVAMCDIMKAGGDVHNYAAELIYGRDFSKDERILAKCYNFLLLYGGGIDMLRNTLVKMAGIQITGEQAFRDKKKWLRTWAEINVWQQKGVRDWKKGRLGSTPLGRQYKANMLTDQLNIENQGAGAEVAKYALDKLLKDIKVFNEEHDTDFMVCNFVHDSYTLEGPDIPELYEPVCEILASAMKYGWTKMCPHFNVKDLPMPVTVCAGPNLADLEDEKGYDYILEAK